MNRFAERVISCGLLAKLYIDIDKYSLIKNKQKAKKVVVCLQSCILI